MHWLTMERPPEAKTAFAEVLLAKANRQSSASRTTSVSFNHPSTLASGLNGCMDVKGERV
jgi:hypothetical protein